MGGFDLDKDLSGNISLKLWVSGDGHSGKDNKKKEVDESIKYRS